MRMEALPSLDALEQADASYTLFESFETWLACGVNEPTWMRVENLVAEAKGQESDRTRCRVGG